MVFASGDVVKTFRCSLSSTFSPWIKPVKEFNSLDVWVGNFDSESRLFDEFLEESYDDDDEPISEFAHAQDAGYYDHDFLEAEFEAAGFSFDTEIVPSGFVFDGDSATQAKVQLAKAQLKSFNTKLFVFGQQFPSPKSCKDTGYELLYLGRFATKPM